jgi:hypothetical protein
MAHKLGAAFLRCSLGPLHYAGGLILSRKVAEGLNELSAECLHGGLERGIAETAQQAGVPVTEVQRLLPMADIRTAAAALDIAQKNAVAAWAMHAGHLGGLMQGVADLTVDGRAPDVSQFLTRLARKVVRDRPLSEPLQALADAVERWLDLVEQCGDLIGDGATLAAAYKRRRLKRVAAVAAAALGCVAASVVVLWIVAVRARVDKALAATDPCAAAAIDPGDLARASSAQQRRADEMRATCEDKRRREEQARLEKERAEAREREAAAKKREHEERCAALAAHLEAGALAPEDEATAGEKAALLGRAAKKALEKGDLVETELPCADTPSSAKIKAAFGAAVAASPGAWSRPDDIGAIAHDALVAQKDALPGSPKQMLSQHADKTAMKAIVSRDDGAKNRATTICRLADELGVRGGKYCSTLAVLAAKQP